ncbi:hypothetical protein BDIM_20020 [Brevundimonas diminuta ATCC 11568]|nr:hypothetical protein BDIM_20020 [Brevundimonas diminuta ATCC 11568]
MIIASASPPIERHLMAGDRRAARRRLSFYRWRTMRRISD